MAGANTAVVVIGIVVKIASGTQCLPTAPPCPSNYSESRRTCIPGMRCEPDECCFDIFCVRCPHARFGLCPRQCALKGLFACSPEPSPSPYGPYTPAPSPSPELRFTITTAVDKNNKKCLDLAGGDATNGNRVQLWECNGLPSQEWLIQDSTIHYAANPNKCLDISGGAKNMRTPGTKLEIWDCNGLPNQLWGYDFNMRTVYAANSFSDASMCMDLVGASLNDGSGIQVWGCNGHANQQWRLWSVGQLKSLSIGQQRAVDIIKSSDRKDDKGTVSPPCCSIETDATGGRLWIMSATGIGVPVCQQSNEERICSGSSEPYSTGYGPVVDGTCAEKGLSYCFAGAFGWEAYLESEAACEKMKQHLAEHAAEHHIPLQFNVCASPNVVSCPNADLAFV